MTYIPEHLERWEPGSGASAFDSSANYSGADLSEFFLAPIHKTRDTADALTLSNWQVISSDLEKISTHDETGETTIRHWGCGWYALFLIHQDDEPALRAADDWAACLAEYPIADESHLSETELEQEAEHWESWGRRSFLEELERILKPYAPDSADHWWANELLDAVPEARIDELWAEIGETFHENDGPSFMTVDAADSLHLEDLCDLLEVQLLAPDQQWRAEPYPWPGAPAGVLLKAENI